MSHQCLEELSLFEKMFAYLLFKYSEFVCTCICVEQMLHVYILESLYVQVNDYERMSEQGRDCVCEGKKEPDKHGCQNNICHILMLNM